MNTLGLLYAQLELKFGLLRAITPKYKNYSYRPSPEFESATESDPSPITESIKSLSTGRINKSIDIDQVSSLTESKREDVIRKLQEWNDQGFIELKPSGVVNRYRMLKSFPKDKDEVKRLVDLAYEQMKERETDDLRRSRQVVELITSEKCFAAALAGHFGDEVEEGACGRCSYCLTGEKVEIGQAEGLKVDIDEAKVQAVLKACGCRDDPRLLARIAFGVSSPRVTAEKCGLRNPIFGSMAECDFDVSGL